jgi:hypothetical protein
MTTNVFPSNSPKIANPQQDDSYLDNLPPALDPKKKKK